jgi:ribosomal protein L37AE/L43A
MAAAAATPVPAPALSRLSTSLLLGRIAVEKGFLRQDQLDQCIREQSTTSLIADRTPRPLGVLLVAKGHLSSEQLTDILAEQKRRLQTLSQYANLRREDILFGRLVVREGLASQEEVNAMLRFQAAMAEQGSDSIPRLGELLVERRALEAEDVPRLLALQAKTLLVCTFCGKQLNVVGHVEGRAYHCRKCGGQLERPAALETLRADETAFEFHLQ